MRQRLLGTLLWCLAVPFAGLWWLLWASLRIAVARVERFFIILGLSFVLSTPNPVTAQLSLISATREAQMALTWVAMAAGILLLAAGARSRWLKRWRWSLQRRGWFLWGSSQMYS